MQQKFIQWVPALIDSFFSSIACKSLYIFLNSDNISTSRHEVPQWISSNRPTTRSNITSYLYICLLGQNHVLIHTGYGIEILRGSLVHSLLLIYVYIYFYYMILPSMGCLLVSSKVSPDVASIIKGKQHNIVTRHQPTTGSNNTYNDWATTVYVL